MASEPDHNRNLDHSHTMGEKLMQLSEQSNMLLYQHARQCAEIQKVVTRMLETQELITAQLRGIQLQVSLYSEQIAQLQRERTPD